MDAPVEIVYRHMGSSPALAASVQNHVDQLLHLFPRLLHCHVVIEAPHRRHRRGNLYRVNLVLDVPGGKVVVGRLGRIDHAHEEVSVALRDAFDAAARRLKEWSRTKRGNVKRHERRRAAVDQFSM